MSPSTRPSPSCLILALCLNRSWSANLTSLSRLGTSSSPVSSLVSAGYGGTGRLIGVALIWTPKTRVEGPKSGSANVSSTTISEVCVCFPRVAVVLDAIGSINGETGVKGGSGIGVATRGVATRGVAADGMGSVRKMSGRRDRGGSYGG